MYNWQINAQGSLIYIMYGESIKDTKMNINIMTLVDIPHVEVHLD